MSTSTISVILILGLPGAGKTTLGRNLARALHARHISMGDLIRKARAATVQLEQQTLVAYRGQATYSPIWLAELLTEAIRTAAPSFLVIDGGPPMHQVAQIMNLNLQSVFFLQTPEDLCRTRYEKRRTSTERREDDFHELFVARSQWYRMHLPPVLEYFDRQQLLFRLDGAADVHFVLRQALACLTLCEVTRAETKAALRNMISPTCEGDLALVIQDLQAAALQEPEVPWRWCAKNNTHHREALENNLVLLCKPGLTFQPSAFRYIQGRLAQGGYEVAGVSLWSGFAVQQRQAIQAHLDMHYLVAQWGTDVLSLADDGPWLAAYKYAARFGFEHLAQIWDGLSGAPPTRLARSVWMRKDPTTGVSILNGHIPMIVEQFHQPNHQTVALHLRQAASAAESWADMRERFLGCSDPAQAPDDSLRGMAHRGRLDIEGNVNFQNNAFHLSAGPLEAYRELIVWFGREYAEQVFTPLFPPGTRRIRNLCYDRSTVSAGGNQTLYEWTVLCHMLDRYDRLEG